MTENRVNEPATGVSARPFLRTVATVLAAVLVVVWVAWWVKSVGRNGMLYVRQSWVPPLPFIAGDFKMHIDRCSRLYASGVNPYNKTDDFFCALFPYPPTVVRLFSWVALFTTETAIKVWLSTLGLIYLTGAYAAWKTRRALGLWPVPLAVLAAALLYSNPAIMAMERGQIDPLVIPSLLGVAWLLRREATWRDLSAGALLAVTAWLKYYPGLAVVAFLALRRDKATAAFVVVAALIGLVDRVDALHSMANGRLLVQLGERAGPSCSIWQHSLVGSWPALCEVRLLKPLGALPAPVAAAGLLLPVVGLVGLRFARARAPENLAFPFMLWLSTVATFGMPYSNDYSIATLPLAALCVWDRRDPVVVHIVMGMLLLWWQPFALTIGGEVLMAIKLAGLYAVGVSLEARAMETGQTLFRPHLAFRTRAAQAEIPAQ